MINLFARPHAIQSRSGIWPHLDWIEVGPGCFRLIDKGSWFASFYVAGGIAFAAMAVIALLNAEIGAGIGMGAVTIVLGCLTAAELTSRRVIDIQGTQVVVVDHGLLGSNRLIFEGELECLRIACCDVVYHAWCSKVQKGVVLEQEGKGLVVLKASDKSEDVKLYLERIPVNIDMVQRTGRHSVKYLPFSF